MINKQVRKFKSFVSQAVVAGVGDPGSSLLAKSAARAATYFKHFKASELSGIDGWIRMRLRSILRKRRGLRGRGRGKDHQRWPNRYFSNLGLFFLLDARELESASLRQGANH